MPFEQLDRTKVMCKPLAQRANKVHIESDHVSPGTQPRPLNENAQHIVREIVERLKHAKDKGASRMLTFGAHAIKNGLGPVFAKLIEEGWITHLATNGAGIIHDWEFAYLGHSSEDVRANVTKGEFGTWEETGFYINLAILAGAFNGFGYGESVGALVENEGLEIPSEAELTDLVKFHVESEPDRAAAAADFLSHVRSFGLEAGWMSVPHPFKQYGLQSAAYRLGVPYTGHPMIGHDIIYVHPMNNCAAIGRASQRDFLSFAQNISKLEDGVYISIGSAVMSPMIFEKSLSMAQNIAIQAGGHIDNHFMAIVDLAESHWDWTKGEPPADNPDYYLRYNKTFARMGGTMRYLSADNRDFLLTLVHALENG